MKIYEIFLGYTMLFGLIISVLTFIGLEVKDTFNKKYEIIIKKKEKKELKKEIYKEKRA